MSRRTNSARRAAQRAAIGGHSGRGRGFLGRTALPARALRLADAPAGGGASPAHRSSRRAALPCIWMLLDWNAKVGSQETPGVTGKFGLGVQNEAGQRLIEFYQENALVIANALFQQHKRRLYTWTSPDGQH